MFKVLCLIKIKQIFILYVLVLLTSCSQSAHFLNDSAYRHKVENTFAERRTLFADTSLFCVFNTITMSRKEREAMTFLYAYMPIGDITDYDGEYYLRNVRSSFEALRELPYCQTVPEELFRHFVLPVRVNNENLDSSRWVFYNELKDRVRNLSLSEAALEVNHWCHEKVVYTPSDSRTSSALASVRTAYGRCGEESTFTVAALRSVGIPARQVYTPRWAHTDDNHAWVEVWADGKWQFMGACEPEPVLNLGWFNAPASRGMLMHTKVFGYYDGPEEIMERTACYTEINVIDNYAPTAKAFVLALNEDGTPAHGAVVEFKLYNYAEFYTVARKTTDSNGVCSLTAGKGDMLVWASKDQRFGFAKLSFGINDTVRVTISFSASESINSTLDNNQTNSTNSDIFEYDIVPPTENGLRPIVTDAQQEDNNCRMRHEDSIRNIYTSTFYTKETALTKAKTLLPDFADEIATLLVKSRGNHAEIEHFIKEHTDSSADVRINNEAIALLRVVSDKDIRDTQSKILSDHLLHSPEIPENLLNGSNARAYNENNRRGLSFTTLWVINPRIANELLTPYKSFFISVIGKSFANEAQKNPQYLLKWVNDSILVRNDLNPQSIPVSPVGVWKGRLADKHSRDIFFVALARSLGIPARIENVTGKVQYFDTEWIDVFFDDSSRKTPDAKGKLQAAYLPSETLDNPKYYSHFTIAKILSNGQLQTLDFDSDSQVDMGGGDTWKELLQQPLVIDVGNYLMVTGRRMASGKVLARTTFFSVVQGETTKLELVIRKDEADISVIGNIDAEKTYMPENGSSETSILATTGRGYFIIGILGSRQEPTNHTLRDIAKYKADFEKWNRTCLLLFTDKQQYDLFDKAEFTDLPRTTVFGIDTDRQILNMLVSALKLADSQQLPVFVIADSFGRVVFVSQGYTIGLGEQMLKVINRL
jgi:transglutaminase-like putative cysteine protease